MTYTKLSNAASALKEVERMNLPFSLSRKIFHIIREVNAEIEFYVSEENKLLEKYNAKRLNDGTITFDNPRDVENYISDMNELNSIEVTIQNVPLILSEKDFDGVTISPGALVNLEGIIEFE